MGFRPSHRNPDDLQPEVCQLCGSYVGQVHLHVSDVEGLRGYRICDLHRMERQHRVRPSYNDMRRDVPPLPVPDVARLQPIGDPLWGNETEEELEAMES
jgi:hypothetical protein